MYKFLLVLCLSIAVMWLGFLRCPKIFGLPILLYSCKETKHVWNTKFWSEIWKKKEIRIRKEVYNRTKSNIQCIYEFNRKKLIGMIDTRSHRIMDMAAGSSYMHITHTAHKTIGRKSTQRKQRSKTNNKLNRE